MRKRIMLALAAVTVIAGAAVVSLGAAQANAETCTIVQCPPYPEGPCGITGTLCTPTPTTTPAKVPPQPPRRPWGR